MRTDLCTRPDECVRHGYKDFVDPYTLPERYCPDCGRKMMRPRSKKYTDRYRVVDLVCCNPDCGKKLFLHVEVRETP